MLKENQKYREAVIKVNFMKARIILFLLFINIFFKSNAQVFFINLKDSAFIFNESILKSNEKTCHIFNCLSKTYSKQGNLSLRPLILFKVFDDSGSKSIDSIPIKSIALNEYMKSKVLLKLALDMQLRARDFEVSNSDPNYHVIDSLIIFDGNSYSLIKGGVIVLEFFNAIHLFNIFTNLNLRRKTMKRRMISVI